MLKRSIISWNGDRECATLIYLFINLCEVGSANIISFINLFRFNTVYFNATYSKIHEMLYELWKYLTHHRLVYWSLTNTNKLFQVQLDCRRTQFN